MPAPLTCLDAHSAKDNCNYSAGGAGGRQSPGRGAGNAVWGTVYTPRTIPSFSRAGRRRREKGT